MKIKLQLLLAFIFIFLSGCNYKSTQNLHRDMEKVDTSIFFQPDSKISVLKGDDSYLFVDISNDSISIKETSLLVDKSITREKISHFVKPDTLPANYYIAVVTHFMEPYEYYPFVYNGEQGISWVKPSSTIKVSSKEELTSSIKDSIKNGKIKKYTELNNTDSLSAISKLEFLEKNEKSTLSKDEEENNISDKKSESNKKHSNKEAAKENKITNLVPQKAFTLAVFFGALILIMKILDWYLTDHEKESLRKHITRTLQSGVISSASLIKAPLSVLTKLFDSSLGSTEHSFGPIKKSVFLGSIVMVACLSVSGLMSNTYFGFNANPLEAYDNNIETLEISYTKLKEGEYNEEFVSKYNIDKELALAKEPVVKWLYITLIPIFSFFIATLAFITSLSFSRNVARELQKTESLILIFGALLLGLTVSAILATLSVVILFTISSIILIFVSILGSALIDLSFFWSVGAATGYSIYSWIDSPIWIRAISIASIVPSLLLIIASLVSGSVYPFRKTIGKLLRDILNRAVQSDKGVIVFAYTGLSLLGTAIVMATGITMG